MINKLTTLALLFLIVISTSCCGDLFAQTVIEKYVRENTAKVTNIEPDSVNYADLEVIGNAIGDSRIVMLGEQDHGDAPTFLAKTRLVKYLHEKKGFNVLAFESDFFGLNYGWDHLIKTPSSINTFLNKNIFNIWTQCNTCRELFQQYIPGTFNSNTPLQISSFDEQLFLNYSSLHLTKKLDSVIERLQLPIASLPNYKTEILPVVDTQYHLINITKDTLLLNKQNQYLTQIKNELIKKIDPNNFWMFVIENMIEENHQLKLAKENFWKKSNTRDKQMALNLKWLCQIKYPNEKIIVWAHNYHVSKYNGHYPEHFFNEAITMGGVFTSDTLLMHKTYIIGFTSFEGTAGRINGKRYKLPKIPHNSFENWMNPAINYSFVDFKKFNLINPMDNEFFNMSGSVKTPGFHTNQNALWTKIFDGVFYIKDMYPCEVQ